MTPLQLKRIRPNDRLWALLIDTLWKQNPGLYFEKYLSEADPEVPEQIWLKNKISETIDFALTLGQDHLLEGNRSAAFGQGAVTKSFMEIVLGAYNLIPEGQNPEEWIPTDLLLTLGNGPDKDHRSNVFEIYKNGLFRFLQAIVIGAYPALPEGQTPKPGAIQYTQGNGFEKWNDTDGVWEPMGSGNTYITNIINNNYQVTVIINSEVTNIIQLPVAPIANGVMVYYNGARQMPATFTVNPDYTVELNFTIYEGDTILIDFVAATTHGTICNEIPTGLINGINKQYALTKTPLAARPFKNGKRLFTDEFTLTATGIETTRAPDEGDTLLIDFDY